MTPEELYDFAIRYEGQQADGEWVEVLAMQQSLEQAEQVWADIAPFLTDMANVRNAGIVFTPKIQWQPYEVAIGTDPTD
ncbi:hypothetical protein SEA_BIANCATRI92_9 [Mycobacterium phage BiancaTri92]|nr:hypothetical protein SEA_LEOGANIA_9 [Mycobacterium phage Leogania]QGJ90909.1 hypothetical protein SEA_BIANCATRI92_9 [Mycobacterium phage BiancaTri92]